MQPLVQIGPPSHGRRGFARVGRGGSKVVEREGPSNWARVPY